MKPNTGAVMLIVLVLANAGVLLYIKKYYSNRLSFL